MDGLAIQAQVSQNQRGRNETKDHEEQPEIPVCQRAPSEKEERRDDENRNKEYPRSLAHVSRAATEAGPDPLSVVREALHHEIPGGDHTQKQQWLDRDMSGPLEKDRVEGHQHGRYVRRRPTGEIARDDE